VSTGARGLAGAFMAGAMPRRLAICNQDSLVFRRHRAFGSLFVRSLAEN